MAQENENGDIFVSSNIKNDMAHRFVMQLEDQKNELIGQLEYNIACLENGNLKPQDNMTIGQEYKRIENNVEALMSQIEEIQKRIDLALAEIVSRGDYSQLGINSLDDFEKATNDSAEMEIQQKKEEIEKLKEAKRVLEENQRMIYINLIIEDISKLSNQIEENNNLIKQNEEEKEKLKEEIDKLKKDLDKASEDEKECIEGAINEKETQIQYLETSIKNIKYKINTIKEDIKKDKETLSKNGVDISSGKVVGDLYYSNKDKIKANKSMANQIANEINLQESDSLEDAIDKAINDRLHDIEGLITTVEHAQNPMGNSQEQNNDFEQPTNSNSINISQMAENSNNGPQNSSNQQSAQMQGNSVTNNVPAVQKKNRLFAMISNGVKSIIDRFDPEMIRKREEYIKAEHPNWDDVTIRKMANSKEIVRKLNHLMQKGVTPQQYASSENSHSYKMKMIKSRLNIIKSDTKVRQLGKLDDCIIENQRQENYRQNEPQRNEVDAINLSEMAEEDRGEIE